MRASPGEPIIVWFRMDLRLADNAALTAAVERGGRILPIYIWAPEEEGTWPPGAASRWWLHYSLKCFSAELQRLGAGLVIQRGPSLNTLLQASRRTGAGAVFWSRRYEPALAKRDAKVMDGLRAAGIETQIFPGTLMYEPEAIRNKQGKPFQVFTPFWRACIGSGRPIGPLPRPKLIRGVDRPVSSLTVEALELLPKKDWAGGLRTAWSPGEVGARAELDRFVETRFADYDDARNFPSVVGTSRLSPHLHFGEISPRQVWKAVLQKEGGGDPREAGQGAANRSGRRGLSEASRLAAGDTAGYQPALRREGNAQFLAELGWREFAYHLLVHFPDCPEKPLRSSFEKFPWRKEPEMLKAWQCGRTGYPLVDAGMRELWASGWMHNRVRMVVASFLVKNLMIPWQEGARWFWDTLVDADLANNTLGWQWSAGCGADAAPFFRIFNPVTQGEKFDPNGEYVRRWVPELSRLPGKWIHQPARAPESVLTSGGVRIGPDYPSPVVSLFASRERALSAYARLKGR